MVSVSLWCLFWDFIFDDFIDIDVDADPDDDGEIVVGVSSEHPRTRRNDGGCCGVAGEKNGTKNKSNERGLILSEWLNTSYLVL